jgi:hypothetical protein
LIDPTAEDPSEQLAFLPTTGELKPIGPKGQPSIDVFGLNDAASPRKLPQARREALLKLQLIIEEYDARVTARDAAGSELAKQTIQDEPFPAVLAYLIALARVPGVKRALRPGIPALLRKHKIASW